MDLEKAKYLLIGCLSQPKGTRLAFLRQYQNECRYSDESFGILLYNASNYWKGKVDKANNDSNKTIISGVVKNSIKIPIPSTNSLMIHIGYDEIKILSDVIQEIYPLVQKEDSGVRRIIVDLLEKVRNSIKDKGYDNLVNALEEYFENSKFPSIPLINVSKINKKRFGYQLNLIYRECKSDNSILPYEYVKFVNENISIFRDYDLDENEYRKSKVYKYLTTNPDKNN
tara:strand:- start:1393 stop:2073 length:681 start_codon:yes stop_codon:yes gene_type:complete